MRLKLNQLLLVVVAACGQNDIIAQKPFQTVIEFPATLDTRKVSIKYDDGMQMQEVNDSIINKKVSIRGKSFSREIALDISYLNERRQSIFTNTYFLTYGSSSIKFTDSIVDVERSTFGRSKLNNATDVKNSLAWKRDLELVKDEGEDINNFIGLGIISAKLF